MTEQQETVIKVDLDVEAISNNLADATNKLGDAKAALADLRKETKNFTDVSAKQAKEIAYVKDEIDKQSRAVKSNTALLQVAGTQTIKNTDSLDEQRRIVNTLQKAYAQLSGDEKVAADAQGGLRDQIKAATDALKEQEHAIGDDRRNVGNYAESMQKAFGTMGEAADVLKEQLQANANLSPEVAKGIDQIGKVGKAFAKNPILGVLAILVFSMQNSKETTASFASILQVLGNMLNKLTPIINAVSKVLTEVLLKAIEWVTDGIKWLLQKIDALGKKFGKDWNVADKFEEFADEVTKTDGALKELTETEDKFKKQFEKDWDESIEQIKNADKSLRDYLKTLEKVSYQIQAKYAGQEANEDDALYKKRNELLDKYVVKHKEGLEKQLNDLRMKNQQELWAIQSAEQQGILSHEEAEAAKTKITEDYAEERSRIESEGIQKVMQERANELQNWSGQILGVFNEVSKAMAAGEKKELNQYKKDQNAKRKALDQRLERGEISQEQYMASVSQMDAELEKKEAEIADKQAKREKALAIMGAVINTATAIMRIWADVPKIDFGASTIALTAFAAALGAAQIATIAAEPLPSASAGYKDGVLLGGTYDGKDDQPAMLSKGEMVLNPKQASTALWNMANGSMVGNGFDYDRLAAAMSNQPAPIMDYREFTQFGKRVSTIKEIARV